MRINGLQLAIAADKFAHQDGRERAPKRIRINTSGQRRRIPDVYIPPDDLLKNDDVDCPSPILDLTDRYLATTPGSPLARLRLQAVAAVMPRRQGAGL